MIHKVLVEVCQILDEMKLAASELIGISISWDLMLVTGSSLPITDVIDYRIWL